MASGEQILLADEQPNDIPAERAVLGGILSDSGALIEVATLLQPGDFHSEANAAVFSAIVELDRTNQAIDTLTVASLLKNQGKLSLAGGPGYLAELETSVPTTANIVSYARLVKEKSVRRKMLRVCSELSGMAAESSTKVEELLDEAQKSVLAISEENQTGDLRSIADLMPETLSKLDQLRATGGGVTGLPTGFPQLDQMLTGLHAGELIIIAARPGCGKTTIGLNICCHAAIREKKPVAIFSLEMPADQLCMRLLASEARYSLKSMRSGYISKDAQSRIEEASFEIGCAQLHIDDSGLLSSFDLRTKVRRLQTRLEKMEPKQTLGLILIDYLQLMHQKGKVESRQQEVQEISRTLKALAKELKVPIIALAQLNRKVEERRGAEGKPMLSDLRESGSIEQDADVVLFLHSEKKANDEELPPGAPKNISLIIAKQRNGPTGDVPLLLFNEFTRFETPARPEQEL